MPDFYRPNPPPVVDILIRGWGNLELTRALLASLEANTPAPAYQATYVDNGSDLEAWAALARDFPAAQHVRLPFNHGSVRAINVGLQLALLSPAPYILLLDNDTEAPAGDATWLARFADYLEDGRVGAAGAVSDYVSGMQNCEALPDVYQKDWQVAGEGAGRKDPPAPPVLVSFALLLRKEAVRQVGWWDERFEPKNFEDYDYTLRLRETGWQLRVANSVWVHHRGQHKETAMQAESMNANGQKFVEKWGAARLSALGLQVR